MPWLNFILGKFESIPALLCPGVEYEPHPSAWYLNAFLSVFHFQGNDKKAAIPQCTEPFRTLCLLMERDGYFVEAQELREILFAFHYGKLNTEAMRYHLKKLVRITFEHGLLFAAADAEIYYADEMDAVLREYPNSFALKIRKVSKEIYANFARFSEKTATTSVYARLSEQDYRYVFYAINGFSNKQVAQICGISERTVANRYNDIYTKLGVSSKQALGGEMSVAFGGKGSRTSGKKIIHREKHFYNSRWTLRFICDLCSMPVSLSFLHNNSSNLSIPLQGLTRIFLRLEDIIFRLICVSLRYHYRLHIQQSF